jgi:phage shock protein A
MNLISRLHDLLLANAHATVDRAEDPEKMIKHLLREMDDQIRGAQAAVVSTVAAEKQLAGELDHHRHRSRDLAAKAESAVAAEREDLARELLARKAEYDEGAAELARSWESAKSTSASLKAKLDALVAKRAQMVRRQQSLTVLQRSARARTELCRSLTPLDSRESTEEKFRRMQARVTELDAESLALCEVIEHRPEPERQAREAETRLQVELELKAIKQRLGP